MNLRFATLGLLIGSVYTVLHKVVLTMLPQLSNPGPTRTVVTWCWAAATSMLILWAACYLVELSPRRRGMRYSLIGIIVFTTVTIFLKLPVGLIIRSGLSHKLAFGFMTFGNAVALLWFVRTLVGVIPVNVILRRRARLVQWALSATCVLSLASFIFLIHYWMTRQEVAPIHLLQPLAGLVFLWTYVSIIWFLIEFYRLPSYEILAGK